MEKLFLSKDKFSTEVESVVRERRLSYMDAIIDICEERDIELEVVGKYINKNIKVKLEVEAQDLNYLPRGNTLFGL